MNMQVVGNTPTGPAVNNSYYDGANGCCETCMSDPTCGGFVAVTGAYPTCYFKDNAAVSSEVPPTVVQSGFTTFYKETLVNVPWSPPSPPTMTCGTGGGYTRFDNKNMQTVGSAPTGVASSTTGYGGGDECCELCGQDPTCGGFIATSGQYATCYFKDRSTTVSEVPPAVNETGVTTFYKDDVLTEADSLRFNGLVRVEVAIPTVGSNNAHWSYHMQNMIFTIQSDWLNWGSDGWASILQDGCDVNVDGACSSMQWYSCKDDVRPADHQCNNVYAGYFGQAGGAYAKAGVPPGAYNMKLTVAGPNAYTGWETDCMQWPTTAPVNQVSFEVRPNYTTVITGNVYSEFPTDQDGNIFCHTHDWAISYETIESRFPGLLPTSFERSVPNAPERHGFAGVIVASSVSVIGAVLVFGGATVKLLQIKRRRRMEQIRNLPVLEPLNLAHLSLTSKTADAQDSP